jgi:hypothetical protein
VPVFSTVQRFEGKTAARFIKAKKTAAGAVALSHHRTGALQDRDKPAKTSSVQVPRCHIPQLSGGTRTLSWLKDAVTRLLCMTVS